MSLDPEAAEVADDALRRLVDALATKDIDRVLPLFTPNASLFGAGDDEVAIGLEAMRPYLTTLLNLPSTMGWTWQVTAAGRDADVVWFVAPGVAVLTDDEGAVRRIEPYRLSGVLRHIDRDWLFELFNGSEPTVPD